ncbi:MAG TPA: ABC transporter permease [Acidimicrobiales bacterium]|nr:ABC transporter permease [Acidimicrobiales bacterium]
MSTATGTASTTVRPRAPRPPLLVAGLVIVAAFGAVALLGPLLAPYDPSDLSGGAVEHPSARHLLGTNDIGQDIFSELIIGTRSSLVVAIPGATLAVAIGILVGVGAGLRGGWVDVAVMRVVDGFLALPGLPLVVLLASLAGTSRVALVVVIAMAGWPPIAHVLHSQVLQLRNRGFVRAARGFGASSGYVMGHHLVPAVGPIAAAGFVQWASTGIVLEAGLAFLGLGDPSTVSWGTMLNRALDYQGLYYSSLWIWWVLPAGLAITLAALGFAFVGVGLEPRFNPQWRKAL